MSIFNTLHTTHGRPADIATGVKLAKPNLKVIVIMGDGECRGASEAITSSMPPGETSM